MYQVWVKIIGKWRWSMLWIIVDDEADLCKVTAGGDVPQKTTRKCRVALCRLRPLFAGKWEYSVYVPYFFIKRWVHVTLNKSTLLPKPHWLCLLFSKHLWWCWRNTEWILVFDYGIWGMTLLLVNVISSPSITQYQRVDAFNLGANGVSIPPDRNDQ